MRNWLKKNKTEIIIFFLALVPRLFFTLIAFWRLGDEAFVKNQDTYLYAGLNLLKHGVFTGNRTFPLIPHSFPAPGYPIIIALSWLIIPRFLAIALWQGIVYSLFVVFVYKFSRLFFNNFVSLGAALFMAFEPFSLFWSSVIMSETPFLLFFILSLYYLALFWQNRTKKYFIYSSFFLGISALIRPIAVFFYPVVVVISLIMLWRKISWRSFVKFMAVYLVVFLIIISPWCLRNKIRFGSFTISNLPHYLYFLTASRDFLILSKGMSQTQADTYLQNLAVQKAGVKNFDEMFCQDRYFPILKEISFSLIKANPFNYLKWHIIKSLPVLTDSGWLNILLFWKVDLGKAQSISLSNLVSQRNIKTIFLTLKDDYIFLIRIIGIIFWLIIDLIALIGLFLMLKKKELFKIALVMLAIISYFVFASSWGAMARLRLPFQPFLFILFFYTLYRLKEYGINWLKLSEKRNVSDLDNPKTTLLHAEIIRRKTFLKKLYVDFYNQLKNSVDDIDNKKVVELGSGGGFIKKIISNAITSDIIKLPYLDKCFSALNMPFKDNSVDAFLMINVLHHIENVRIFFKEANRCLKKGGKIVMIEPANTLWSRFIFQNFHHELFDPSAKWELKGSGPLSSANDALAWIIFCRDRKEFEREFSFFRIKKLRNHTPFRYLISGGFSVKQLLPSFSYGLVKIFEGILSPFNNYLGMFMTIELEK